MIKRILVGLGGTPFTTVAVNRAVELARTHGAMLTGVTVIDMERLQNVGPVPLGGSTYAKKMVQQRIAGTGERVEQAVSWFKKTCSDECVAFSVEMETGNPFDLMIAHARYHDLIIFGLKSLFDYGIAPEPKDALIRLVSQGVRPILAVSSQLRTVRKALIAYSGSMESAKSMRRFIQMRLWPDVKVQVVQFSRSGNKEPSLLRDAADYCRSHGYETDTVLIEETVDKGLLTHARRADADIIVMGNSIRSLVSRKILGSTALSTIQNADRPLFLAQ